LATALDGREEADPERTEPEETEPEEEDDEDSEEAPLVGAWDGRISVPRGTVTVWHTVVVVVVGVGAVGAVVERW